MLAGLAARIANRRRARGGADDAERDRIPTMAEVDRVLDKVIAEGLSSLTHREREILTRASRRREGSQTPRDR